MKYVLTPLVGFVLALVSLIVPPLVLPFLMWFARWDRDITRDIDGRFPLIRGDLPRWLAWFETPDERLPGGLYEPTVEKVYVVWGKWVCTYYWLGLRNRAFGLARAIGKPTTDYIPEGYGFWERGDVWRHAGIMGLPRSVLFGLIPGALVYLVAGLLGVHGDPALIVAGLATLAVAVPIQGFKYVVGWQVYKYLDGQFWAVPVFTIKRA